MTTESFCLIYQDIENDTWKIIYFIPCFQESLQISKGL